MCNSCLRQNARRAGFTLVEMLVVLVILIIIAALTLAIAPRLAEREQVAKGADLMQQWALTARVLALRDQGPRGIRLQPVPIVVGGRTFVPVAPFPVPIPVQLAPPSPTPFAATVSIGQVTGTTSEGLKWSIVPGMMLVVYDPDPNAPAGDTESFVNSQAVRVTAINVGAGTFTATGFTNLHPGGFFVKVLAYVRDIQ